MGRKGHSDKLRNDARLEGTFGRQIGPPQRGGGKPGGSRSDQAYRVLKTRLLLGEFPLNVRLGEEKLAAIIGVCLVRRVARGDRRVIVDPTCWSIGRYRDEYTRGASVVALIEAVLAALDVCIGTVELSDGSQHKGFLCELRGLEGAVDITDFGGWRNYLGSL